MSDFRLCYVDEPWAWFTTADLKDQWGDDWNDAPYEHNAGDPYKWRANRDVPPYELLRVAFVGPFETPASWVTNSSYSVEHINAGIIPWLQTDRYSRNGHAAVAIPAGTVIAEFVRLVELADGTVFLPRGVLVS